MCLGIPGQVVETYEEHDVLMGKVDFGGVFKRVCLEHVPQVRLNDYVIVHVGFALSVVDEEEAKQVFAFLERMNELDELEAGRSSVVGGPSHDPPGKQQLTTDN
jgi:hydrogenase expression/formation protein HypC